LTIQRKIAVVGLGYVGLSIAVHFGKKQPVTGFDINATRIEELKKAFDRNRDLKAAGWKGVSDLLEGGRGRVADIKNLLPRDSVPDGVTLWRL
jgi:UDP-N-acetyl-D-mannosaminuronate dehydrogenase